MSQQTAPQEFDMTKRIARFRELKPYKSQMKDSRGIPAAAMERISAKNVYPVMSPEGWTGRNAIAPVKGEPGITISIAECPPGDNPGLHIHTRTTENFFCLNGRFRLEWGPNAEHHTILEQNDFMSVPAGVYRNFVNLSDETARLLVVIQTQAGDTEDEVLQPPGLRAEMLEQFGAEALEKMGEIGVRFAAE